MVKTKVVLFDYDGVLAKKSKSFSQRVFDRQHIRQHIVGQSLKYFFDNIFPLCKVGKKDLKEELSKIYLDSKRTYIQIWGFDRVENLFEFWFKDEINNLNEQVFAFVNDLKSKKIKLGVVTNNEKYRTNHLKENILKNFNYIFNSVEFEYLKSNKVFHMKVLSKLVSEFKNLKEEEILIIDDELENLEAASLLGFQTFQFQNENLENQIYSLRKLILGEDK